jgi:hypothetical protein
VRPATTSRKPSSGPSRWIDLSTALDGVDLVACSRVRVTHPFHPLAGQELEFVERQHNWQRDRVYGLDEQGELVSLPAEWTDAVAADPFVVVSAGRSPFHVEALLELSELVASVAAGHSRERATRVKGITPWLST